MGRKWTQDDLLTYEIKVVHQDLRTFFAVTDLPSPNVADDALTVQDYTTQNPDLTAVTRRTNVLLLQMANIREDDNRVPSIIDFVYAFSMWFTIRILEI